MLEARLYCRMAWLIGGLCDNVGRYEDLADHLYKIYKRAVVKKLKKVLPYTGRPKSISIPLRGIDIKSYDQPEPDIRYLAARRALLSVAGDLTLYKIFVDSTGLRTADRNDIIIIISGDPRSSKLDNTTLGDWLEQDLYRAGGLFPKCRTTDWGGCTDNWIR